MKKPQLLQTLKEKGFPEKIANAFEKVQRENFVPENAKKLAYENIALPIGNSATISQPSTIATMLLLLQLEKNQKVLEIGSGCGYVLALLSEIVGEKGKVFGIEVVKELAETSKENLKEYGNVEIFNKNGKNGLPEKAPFDRILISAALKKIPEEVLNQLKENGIVVAPLGSKSMQTLNSIKRVKNEFITIKKIPGFVFVPFLE